MYLTLKCSVTGSFKMTKSSVMFAQKMSFKHLSFMMMRCSLWMSDRICPGDTLSSIVWLHMWSDGQWAKRMNPMSNKPEWFLHRIFSRRKHWKSHFHVKSSRRNGTAKLSPGWYLCKQDQGIHCPYCVNCTSSFSVFSVLSHLGPPE